MGGDAGQRGGDGIHVADQRWSGVQEALVHAGIFSERSLSAQQSLVRAPNSIADLEAADASSHVIDGASQIAAGNERLGERHRHDAGANVGVDRIDGDSVHAHADLASSRRGRRQLAILNDLRPPGRFQKCRLHRDLPFRSGALPAGVSDATLGRVGGTTHNKD